MKSTTPMAYLQVWTEGADANRGMTGPLRHTASDVFRARGVQRGDRVFVAEVVDGQLQLIGRIVVADVVNQEEAEETIDHEVWDARDHLIAVPGASLMADGRPVAPDIAAELRFLQKTGRVGRDGAPRYRLTKLKLNPEGRLEGQTTRTVRRLVEESAASLEELLILD
jgi:hypothetical protein